MKLVFTGIQGCGKGTQARLLKQNFGFKLVEMGAMLREIAKTNTPLGNIIKNTIEQGHQVDPQIVGEVIKQTFQQEASERVIYDGFIRNEGNKQAMEEVCLDYRVIFFQLSKEKAMQRLLGRMYDPISEETFSSEYTINPKTGNPLIKRKDDNEISIMNRINAFVEKTLPVIEKQHAEGKVIEINADQSIEQVQQEIIDKLGLYQN